MTAAGPETTHWNHRIGPAGVRIDDMPPARGPDAGGNSAGGADHST